MDAEWVKSAWLWLGNEIATFGLRWVVMGFVVLGCGGFIGWRYRELKREIAGLRGSLSPTVNVQNIVESRQPNRPPLVNPAAQPRSADAPEVRLRALVPLLEEFASGRRNDYPGI